MLFNACLSLINLDRVAVIPVSVSFPAIARRISHDFLEARSRSLRLIGETVTSAPYNPHTSPLSTLMNSVGSPLTSRPRPKSTAALHDLASAHGPESGHAPHLLFDGLEEAAILLKGESIVYANAAAGKLFDTEPRTLDGNSLSVFLAEAEHGNLYRYLRLTGAKPESLKQRSGAIRRSGLSVPVSIQCLPVRGATGRHLLFIRDLSEVQHETGDHARLLLEELPCGAMRLDPQLRYLYGNRSLTKVAPFFSLAETGKTVTELAWPDSLRTSLVQIVAALSRTPHAHHVSLKFFSDHSQLEWGTMVIPHCDSQGQLTSASFIFDEHPAAGIGPDHETAMTQQLREEREKCKQAVAASRARDAFFGWVSHELRTPMNGIQSWAHIMETYVNASSSSPLAQRALSGIRHGISQQLQLVDELLDVSRVMEGRVSLSKQAFPLRPVLQAAMASVQPAALAHDIHLACHHSLSREKVCADPCRIQQMVRVLLGNLIGESGRGSTVHLQVECLDQQVLIRLHSEGPQLADTPHGNSGKVPRVAKPRGVCRKEVDAFLVRRLAEMQGGCLDYQYENGAALSAITLKLPLHVPARRRTASA